MKKFLEHRKDGSTAYEVTPPKESVFMWCIENQLVSLSLSLMNSIDKRCHEEGKRLEHKRYWRWDAKNKLWWAIEDQLHDPRCQDDRKTKWYVDNMLILQLTDMQPDENGDPLPMSSVHWTDLRWYGYQKSVDEFKASIEKWKREQQQNIRYGDPADPRAYDAPPTLFRWNNPNGGAWLL